MYKIKGYENFKEGDKRCKICYKLRLEFTYNYAIDFINKNNLKNFKNYFCSTLSVSPYKNAEVLYNVAKSIENNEVLTYLINDFKKGNGYLESINISKKYNIYRQNYCGCEFSKI